MTIEEQKPSDPGSHFPAGSGFRFYLEMEKVKVSSGIFWNLSDKTRCLQRSGGGYLNHQTTARMYKAFRLQGSGMHSSLAVTTHMW